MLLRHLGSRSEWDEVRSNPVIEGSNSNLTFSENFFPSLLKKQETMGNIFLRGRLTWLTGIQKLYASYFYVYLYVQGNLNCERD